MSDARTAPADWPGGPPRSKACPQLKYEVRDSGVLRRGDNLDVLKTGEGSVVRQCST